MQQLKKMPPVSKLVKSLKKIKLLMRRCSQIFKKEYSEDRKEEKVSLTNRIYLNFTREYRHPAKDRYNQEKVKELFKYVKERSELQEMKVSGWEGHNEFICIKDENDEATGDENKNNDIEEEEENDEQCKIDMELYSEEESSRKGEGQRFVMSRDFWYRKLNTLKAQKLDEAALEAQDIPPDDESKPPKYIKYLHNNKTYSDESQKKVDDVMKEINKFEKAVAKPVEKELKKKFINVYDNRNYFRSDQ